YVRSTPVTFQYTVVNGDKGQRRARSGWFGSKTPGRVRIDGAAKIEIEKWNSRKPQTSYVPIAGSAWVIGLLPPISCATFGGRKRFGRRVKRSVAAATRLVTPSCPARSAPARAAPSRKR